MLQQVSEFAMGFQTTFTAGATQSACIAFMDENPFTGMAGSVQGAGRPPRYRAHVRSAAEQLEEFLGSATAQLAHNASGISNWQWGATWGHRSLLRAGSSPRSAIVAGPAILVSPKPVSLLIK